MLSWLELLMASWQLHVNGCSTSMRVCAQQLAGPSTLSSMIAGVGYCFDYNPCTRV
jgi:hypothetical protein